MERTKPPINLEAAAIIAQILRIDGYFFINKKLIKNIGLLPTIVLSRYIESYAQHKEKTENFNGWFFLEHKILMEELQLSEYYVKRYKDTLISSGILQTSMRGMPIKEWFRINFNILMNYFYSNPQKYGGLNPQKSEETKIKNSASVRGFFGSSPPRHDGYISICNIVPPTIKMVEEYCSQRKNKVSPEGFHDFYTSKNWMVGKNKMKDWQAAVRTWERSESEHGNTTNNKTPKMKFYDGIRYILGPDGYYRNRAGEEWVD